MEGGEQLNEYCNYLIEDNLFNRSEKNEDDQFPLKLVKKQKLTHDTYKITFEFPNPEWISGHWAGGHYTMHATIDGKTVTRRYTPVSLINQKGSVTFVMKIYRLNPDFPNGGVFSRNLEDSIKEGDSVMVEGPIGLVRYHGFGKFLLKKKELAPKKKLFLLGGGSGLTPLLSIAQASTFAKDGLDIILLYSNKTKDDILCQEELDELTAANPEHFKVYHTLTRHDEAKHGKWDGLTGRVSLDMMKQCGLSEPADDVLIFICGVA